jgi:putative NIF3 family GTP cyclohydrolase 1 type 2
MKKGEVSRREFLRHTAVGVAATAGGAMLARAGSTTITAGEVMERIKQKVLVPWRGKTVDTIKGGGSPQIVVTGITTTFMGTLDVLQRSVQAGDNMVLTHEPIFWNNEDTAEGFSEDPLYLHKLDFIRKNGLFVHRFHDHWHARRPDGIFEGWCKIMGWDRYRFDEANNWFELPEPVTLEAYAKETKKRLASDSVRVVGDPSLKIRTVSRGTNKLPRKGDSNRYPDLTITYEPDRENDNVEWERDTVLSGQKRGFIIVSHNRLEEFGMDNCANWLRGFGPEVPIRFLASGDPFWRTTA